MQKDFYISPYSFPNDSEWRLLNTCEPRIITGPECSGKTLCSIHLAHRFHCQGCSVLFITKQVLKTKYLIAWAKKVGMDSTIFTPFSRCFNYQHDSDEYQRSLWVKGFFDYIFIDDIQFFSFDEVIELKEHAKQLIVNGSFMSSIYHSNWNQTDITLSRLESLLESHAYSLHKNYSTPKGIARIIEYFDDSIVLHHFFNGSDIKPVFARIDSIKKQCESIIKRIKGGGLTDVVILCFNIRILKLVSSVFEQAQFPFEVGDTINFNSTLPKVCTVHNAQGIHFNSVFLIAADDIPPEYSGELLQKVFYITKESLVVYYNKEMPLPLTVIPKDLYSDRDYIAYYEEI